MKELLYLKDDQLKEFIEKISVSYKKTFSDAKKILDKHSIGIAHHKVILLLDTHKGITISELFKKLRVTKQSLNRVLQELYKNNVIVYKRGQEDSRHKHVYLSVKGKSLSNEIFYEQKKRIYKALKNSNSNAVLNFNEVMQKIING